ncbi:MAG: hypothetical protein WCC57_17940 [Paracoccaceae bacterium]
MNGTAWRVLLKGGLVPGAALVLLASCLPFDLVSRSGETEKIAGSAQAQALPGPLQKADRFYSGTIIASDPSIQRSPAGLTMVYTDLDVSTGRTVIARATSADGAEWQPQGGSGGIKGLVIAGRNGEWDENVESSALVPKGSGWELFYSGYRDKGNPFKGFPAALGLASSPDGETFTRVSNDPVMQPTKGWYDNDAIYSPTVLLEGGTYYMVYVGHAYTDTSQIAAGGVYLLAATSTDGMSWTKSPEPLARPGQFGGWRSDGMAEPYLVRRGAGDYLLFYTGLGGEERAIGVATGPSPAGPWEFGSEPLITPGPEGGPDGHQVLAPAAMLDGDALRIWYLAATAEGALSIGQASGSMTESLAATR